MEPSKLTLGRLVYEFTPMVGGSITHVIETASEMGPHIKKQYLLAPAFDDTFDGDDAYPFDVVRVRYHDLRSLVFVKKNILRQLPIAPLIRLSYGLAAIRRLRSLNGTSGIDLIHSHGLPMGMIASMAGRIMKKPVVWMLHGTLEAYSGKSSLFETLVIKIFRPRHVIVLDDGSPAIQKFNALLGEGNVTRVTHAIDTDRFRPLQPDKDVLRELNINEDLFVILSAHSLQPVKNVDLAILAFQRFLESSGSKRSILVIAGDGRLRGDLEAMVRRLGLQDHVRFVGNVDNTNMPGYFSIASAVLGTSVYSNMNRTVQEAMSCGRPVVVFDSGGTGKVIHHRENGLLARAGDVEDLSRRIKDLYEEKELGETLGAEARRYIQDNRSWEGRVNVELSVYSRALSEKER